jgi:hypothetical protein
MPDPRDPTIEDGMFTRPIEGGAVVSLLTIIIPDTFHAEPPPLSVITSGRSIALSIKRFVESYYLHTDIMPKQSYFKSDIIEAAFSNMPDGPIKRALTNTIVGAPEKHHFIFPQRAQIDDGLGNASRWYSMRMLTREIVKAYPADFGYAPHVYYIPHQRRQQGRNVPGSQHLFEHYVIPDDKPIFREYTFTELLNDLLNDQYTNVQDDAADANEVIKFNFPVKVTMHEGPPDDARELPPFNYLQLSGSEITDKLRISSVPVYYQWRENFVNTRTNTQAKVRPPVYQPPHGVYDFDVLAKFLGYPRKVVTYRSGVKDMVIDEIIHTVRRSDI